MFNRIAVAAVAAAVVIGLALWFFRPPGGVTVAAAELMQDKVAKTKSVTLTLKMGDRLQGTEQCLADGRARFDSPDGDYFIVDPGTQRCLTVSPANKQAVLFHGFYSRMPENFYHIIRDIRKDTIKSLGSERVNGRRTDVFVAKLTIGKEEREVKVWIDPESKLPVQLDLTDVPRWGTGRYELHTAVDIVFDQPVDEARFSTEPPEGYTVREEGVKVQPPPSTDAQLLLEVKPKEGLGPIKFGMTKAEVIEKLGQPDKIDQKGTALDYLSRGYSFIVSPQRGVRIIQCFTQDTFVVRVRNFAGKTKDGIGMGSSAADLVRVFGEPDRREQEELTTRLDYSKKLGMEFTLFGDKLVQFMMQPVP
jgi:outer membrane lipoprotein-sorting protein